MAFLRDGVTVCRTADDLTRHHGKMMIVDSELYVLGYNYTELDMNRSRSFGIVTRDPKLVKAASALFQADSTRQPYEPLHDRLVVSPESTRRILSDFIGKAKKELLIYDEKISDKMMLKLLRERAAAGVSVRVIGRLSQAIENVVAARGTRLRLHVRAIVRDGQAVFVGSQSLRRPQIDGRREIGVIVPDSRIAAGVAKIFEEDWDEVRPKAPAVAEAKAAAVAGQ
jgi:phosphatidylserine/phosphatidylglycerophosphate/cardiolipin synthase-like enzyme